MLKIFRLLFFVPKSKVHREAALRIANLFFQQHGVEIDHPTAIEELHSWLIWANGNIKGSAWVRIDNQQGEVKDFGIPMH